MVRVVLLSGLALVLAACSSAPAAQPTAAPTAAPAAPQPTTAPAAAGASTSASASTVSCAEYASQGSGGAPINNGADGSLTGATANFGTGMKRGI
jgi:N-methylhydantoinase B/oxoprolinase/acetone carboxylase alpha subunit